MIDRLIAVDSAESPVELRDALQKACQRMADRDAASTVLLSRMSGASPAAKAELLDLLILLHLVHMLCIYEMMILLEMLLLLLNNNIILNRLVI